MSVKRSYQHRSVVGAAIAIALFVATMTSPALASPRPSSALDTMQSTSWTQNGAWFQRMMYVFASGNAPIQQAATAAGGNAGLTDTQVTAVSRAVRAAWVHLMTADPATLGRVGAVPDASAQASVLGELRGSLSSIAGARYASLLTLPPG